MSPRFDDVNEPEPMEGPVTTATLPDTMTMTSEEDEDLRDENNPRWPLRHLAALRPISRWAATIARFDHDVHYRSFDRVFGVDEVAIIRTPALVGGEYARSCVGVAISCFTNTNGQRTGEAIIDRPDGREEIYAPVVGWIEDAVATDAGISAVLAITHQQTHEDLVALDEQNQLGAAMVCMRQRMEAVRTRTAWGVNVWTVGRTRARRCTLTSLGHVEGQRVVRRLACDEPLSADDLRLPGPGFTPAREVGRGGDGAATGEINEGSINTAHIVPGAVSANSLYSDDTTHVVSPGTETVVATVTVTSIPADARVDLLATFTVQLLSGTTVVIVRVRKGSLSGAVLDFLPLGASTGIPATMPVPDATPAAGSQAYVLTVEGTGGGTSVTRIRIMPFLAKR